MSSGSLDLAYFFIAIEECAVVSARVDFHISNSLFGVIVLIQSRSRSSGLIEQVEGLSILSISSTVHRLKHMDRVQVIVRRVLHVLYK